MYASLCHSSLQVIYRCFGNTGPLKNHFLLRNNLRGNAAQVVKPVSEVVKKDAHAQKDFLMAYMC